jgi:hypothetical protein
MTVEKINTYLLYETMSLQRQKQTEFQKKDYQNPPSITIHKEEVILVNLINNGQR